MTRTLSLPDKRPLYLITIQSILLVRFTRFRYIASRPSTHPVADIVAVLLAVDLQK